MQQWSQALFTLSAVQASFAAMLGEPSFGSGLQGFEVGWLVGPWSGQGLSEAVPEPEHGGICSKQGIAILRERCVACRGRAKGAGAFPRRVREFPVPSSVRGRVAVLQQGMVCKC